jgi:hypothetical protein
MLDADTDFDDRNLSENEEVIAKAINYLKYHDPANANRDYAIGLLRYMQRASRAVADKSELSFEEFVERYNQSLEK